MTRTTLTFKTGIAILSVAATLGTWAVLARNEAENTQAATLDGAEPAVQRLELPPIPTVVRPPMLAAPSVPSLQGNAGLDLPPIPAVSAPVRVPRPVARTRSSR